LTLGEGWRRGNISWRPTTWSLRQMGLGGMKLVDLRDEDRQRLNLAADRMALKAEHVGEYGEHAIAKRAGLRKGDVIVAVDGHDRRLTESQLLEYTLRRKHRGDTLAVTVLRDAARTTLSDALPSAHRGHAASMGDGGPVGRRPHNPSSDRSGPSTERGIPEPFRADQSDFRKAIRLAWSLLLRPANRFRAALPWPACARMAWER